MSEDVSVIYKVLLQQLDQIQAAVEVFRSGIKEELNELSVVEAMKQELYEAINVSSKVYPVISIREYAQAKVEYEKIGQLIEKKRQAIDKIESIIKEKHTEIDNITKKISDFKRRIDGADVLIFDQGKKKL
jgi:signal recognition particle subunit SEC65